MIQFYTNKRDAEAVVKSVSKASEETSENAVCMTVADIVKISRACYVVIKTQSVTSLETFKTSYRMFYQGHIEEGSTVEDCLIKMLGYLTRLLIKAL